MVITFSDDFDESKKKLWSFSTYNYSYLKVNPKTSHYLFVEEEGEGLNSATAIMVINARNLITTIRRSLS